MRYRVTFELLFPDTSATYVVCSANGRDKAVVIAAQKHAASGKGHILGVEVQDLDGDKPQGSDLVDRMEW